MFDRYYSRRIFKNDLEKYKNVFKNRNVKFINQYSSPEFKFPSEQEYNNIQIAKHVWKVGDRYYKLAYEYYGDSAMWWVIAKYNQLPTEAHVEIGDEILIPYPLSTVLNYMTG